VARVSNFSLSPLLSTKIKGVQVQIWPHFVYCVFFVYKWESFTFLDYRNYFFQLCIVFFSSLMHFFKKNSFYFFPHFLFLISLFLDAYFLFITYSHHLLPHAHSSLAYKLACRLFVCASLIPRLFTCTPLVCRFLTYAFVAYLPTHCLFITSLLACHLSICMSFFRLCVPCSSFACHILIVYASLMPCLLAYVSHVHIPTKHVVPCLSPVTQYCFLSFTCLYKF